MQGNWAWGLALTALTIVIHGTGITTLHFLLGWDLETRTHLRTHHLFAILISLIGAVGLLLALLHGIDAALWALAYLWLGALASLSDAMFYSIDTMSTRGASGLTLEHGWRMLGALEAADGVLLFGMSTAFIFAAMQRYWPLLTQRRLAATFRTPA